MKKYLLLLIPCFILIGGGCSSSGDYDSQYYDSYDPSYDSSYDTSSEYDYDGYYIPQGTQTVLACDLDIEYCTYIDAYVEGSLVTSAFDNNDNSYLAPYNSTCDSIGCLFYDSYGDEWYFNFE